jgi:hypothetical protein
MHKNENTMIEHKKLQESWPFLTYGIYLSEHHIGITQNVDALFVNIYLYTLIKEENLKKTFIEHGETWWWESNRLTPINLFIGQDFKIFKPYLKTFARKEFEFICGPIVSISDLTNKKSKRRQIQLVKHIP